ncbi:MAG: IclR family transcriptional regulator [Burkholderiaceae bacterium]
MEAETKSRDYQFASSLESGLKLLRCFDAAAPLLGNADLVRRCGLSRSAVSRLTYTLCELGFLKQDPASRKYHLGAAAVAVGYPLLLSLDVRQRARPAMQALARATHGAVFLGMRERHRIVLIETCRAEPRAAVGLDIGASLSMVGSAIGRAWLAAAPRFEREEVLRAVKRAEPAEFEQYWEEVKTERLRLSKLGYCVSQELMAQGQVSVATLLSGARGGGVVVGCAAPASAGAQEAIGARVVQWVEQWAGHD